MKQDYNRGQISIYLSIVFMSVLCIAAVLTDISRISGGETVVQKALRSAARSAIAEYGTQLKDKYGLFALSSEKCSQAEAVVKKYAEMNLIAPEEQGSIDLYDFRIEELKVTPLFNLSEDGIFRCQVLDYMKYRAPKQLVEGFIDRLKLIRDSGKMSEAYGKKVAIDKITGKMDKSQQKLKKNIDGAGVDGEKFINGFNSNDSWKKAYERFQELSGRYRVLVNDLAALTVSIAALKNELDKTQNEHQNEDQSETQRIKKDNDHSKEQDKDGKQEADRKKKDIENKLSDLERQKSEITQSMLEIRSGAGSVMSAIRQELADPYAGLNQEAIENVKSILETGDKITAAIIEFEQFL